MSDLEKQHSRHSTRSTGGTPLAPTKSRDLVPIEKRTLSNKPDDVDPVIWMEESSVVGIKERKVSERRRAADAAANVFLS